MRNSSIIFLGKTLSTLSKKLNKGNGSTWPGHIALKVNKRFIEDILKKSNAKVIMVAGTNGKTTTSLMIRTLLEGNNHAVVHNESGANLLNGIASTLLLRSSALGKLKAEYVILEIDENALPHALSKVTPHFLIILNLFRDQLDRYGEVDSVSRKWKKSIEKLPSSTHLLLNADDPQVAYLSVQTQAQLHYFGLPKRHRGNVSQYAADSLYCPRCGNKLSYNYKLYSHLGDWFCRKCELKRPEINPITLPHLPLAGTYNEYNTTAVVQLARLLSIPDDVIEKNLRSITPAFGRQEIIEVDSKKVQVFLSKNPTGFNESLRTIAEQKAKHLLIVLNDRIADGQDVSWIWDVDFESQVDSFTAITVSGDRTYDMALRVKYALEKFQTSRFTFHIKDNLQDAIHTALANTPNNETLYVLPTYTAMLQTREILKGRKIL